MRIEPAELDQIRRAQDGRMVMIDSDAGGVARDLRAIDPGLKVRFAEFGRPPFWAVYWESHDGRETHLVLTAKAYQTATGIWTGLDQRVVGRIREIDPHGTSGYDYAAELERNARRRADEQQHRRHESLGEKAERLAHAVRKDLGERYKGRAFVPRDGVQ